jgi:flavin reductase (DIM6/NTAB) family NADH-FMN oxidoreductase RutF
LKFYQDDEMEAEMSKKSFPLSKVYGLLEPGPVVLVTTASKTKANIMTMSWYTMMEFEPPLVGCVISNRNYTFNILKATKECVINIPTVELAEKVVDCGNNSGRKIDKFKVFGLTQVTASGVKALLISECYANLECKVVDEKMVAKYNFFILEVLKAWIDPVRKDPRTIHHRGRGVFMVAGETIKLPSKMK